MVLRTIKLDTALKPDEVLVKWIVSPLNPADINLAEGVYFFKRKGPATMGMDGFGIVEKVRTHTNWKSKINNVMIFLFYVESFKFEKDMVK